jgi:NAD-dependent dihydropyrimidine dehydrogenase PreA subunit
VTAYVVTIRTDTCSGQGECGRVCPVSILSVEARRDRARCVLTGAAERCLGCGVCVVVCPTGAITVTEGRREPTGRERWWEQSTGNGSMLHGGRT